MSSVAELEAAVRQLSRADLSSFARWFEEYLADEWDHQIEADAKAGRLDHLVDRVPCDREVGRSQEWRR